MATDYYKLVGTSNQHTNWVSEVVLEADEDGTPTKVARLGEPVQLSADDRSKLEGLGYQLEESSKSEVEKFASAGGPAVGTDVVGSAPILNTPQAQEAANAGNPESKSDEGSGSKSK